jgi:K+-sensing histidine kinase KdpD
LLVDARSRALAAGPDIPSAGVGIVVAVALIAARTLVMFSERQVAPEISLGVVFLPAVLVVSTVWGVALGAATAVLSTAAVDFFHVGAAVGGERRVRERVLVSVEALLCSLDDRRRR